MPLPLRAFVMSFLLAAPVCAQEPVSLPQDGWRAIASLERDGRPYCMATLLDARHALTAAHCVQDPRASAPAGMGVLVFPDGTRVDVEKAAVHPSFRYASHSGAPLSVLTRDVAVLRLASDAPIAPINLFVFNPDTDGWVYLPDALGAWERCPTRAFPDDPSLFWIGCSRPPGRSGTPVLRVEGDTLNAVGVLLAQSPDGGLFAHAVRPILPELLWSSAAAPHPEPLTEVSHP